MKLLRDITGETHGRLTVLYKLSRSIRGHKFYGCICSCGKFCRVRGSSIIAKVTYSCGCLRLERCLDAVVKHGKSNSDLYHIWEAMIGRCHNENHPSYNNYGGRGILVWDYWRKNPEEFIYWAGLNGYKTGLDIDREDNDKGYHPDNCRFVTRIVNSHNKRRVSIRNTSGYTGVSLHRSTRKYVAELGHKYLNNDTKVYLGCFNTPWEAAEARNKFIKDNNLPHRIQEKL